MSGPSEKSIPSPEGTATILAVSPLPADRVRLREIDGNWENLLKATARLPAPPNLIVFSRLADESLWARVLNLGGFDVLMTPFEPEEVLRITFAAWSRWEYDLVASTAKDAEAVDRRRMPAFRT
jgi:DNA-binding response OmpR family regulator